VVSRHNTGKSGVLCQVTFRHHRRVTFPTRQVLGNGCSHQIYEKLFGRNNAAPEAISASYAKRIMSETVTFSFPCQAGKDERTAICQLEKLPGRVKRLTNGLDPLYRLDQRFTTKGYESEKMKSISTNNRYLFFILRKV
jgi:hypothetical protein